MAYTLVVCEGENNARTLRNPIPEKISRAIDDLIPAPYHFVILEAEPALEKCTYIQTLIEHEGKAKGQYLVEARYKFNGGFMHYRKHIRDSGEVKRFFRKFAEGIAPNTAGWEDITEKLVPATA